MRLPRQFLAATLFVLLVGHAAQADIPVPGETPAQAEARRARQWQLRMEAELAAQRARQGQPAPGGAVPLSVKGLRYQADARLLLPRKLLGGWQAPPGPGAGAPSGGSVAGPALRTAVAGVALSLALAWVGFRVVRSRRRLGLAGLAALLVGAAVLGTGCPGPDKPVAVTEYQPLPLSATADGKLVGEAYVELTDGEEGVVLQLSHEKLEQFLARSGLKTEPAPLKVVP